MSPPITPAVFLWYDSTWNDITHYVYYRDSIQITRGTPNEANVADPASCNLTLNNRDGRFSPRNPRSPLYGKIGRNTPLWVLAAATTPNDYGLFLPNTGVIATTPDTGVLDITGDIDLRAEIRPLDVLHSQNIIAKGNTQGGQLAYQLLMGASTANVPHVTLRWSVDGTAVQFVDHDIPTLQFGKRTAIRATMDVDNGSGAHVVTFYTSSDNTINGTWVQHGSVHTIAGTTSIFSSSAALELGRDGTNDYYYGQIYAVRVLNGIGGSAVANPDFKSLAVGTTSFSDAAGRAWTVTGTIGYAQYSRFLGEVSAWPQQWDQSGKDVYVPIQASGVSRRLGQGQLAAAVDSIRTFVNGTRYYRFWPGDTSASGRIASPLTLNACPAVRFGAGDLGLSTMGMSIPTTAPVRDANGYLQHGYVDGFVGALATSVAAAGFVFKATSLGVLSFVMVDQYAPAGVNNEYEVQFRGDGVNNDIRVLKRTNDIDAGITQTVLGTAAAQTSVTDGNLHVCTLKLTVSGGSLNWEVDVDGALVINGTAASTSLGGVSGAHVAYDPTAITASAVAVGYIAIWTDGYTPDLTAYASVGLGHPGEAAGMRIGRLCSENSVPFYSYGDNTATAAMGAQASGTLTSLLQEAADTDAGFLFDDLHQASLVWTAGLAYITRASIYNRPVAVTLDYSAHVFGAPLNPPEDDQNVHNDVTVINGTGTSAEAKLLTGALSVQAPPNGINTYATSATVNLQTDGPLADHAAWRMHLGTIDEARYPQLAVNLLTPEVVNHTDLLNDILALDITSGLAIKNLPVWLPPDDVSQLVLGYQETFTQFDWTFTANCAPGSPYQPAVYNTDRYDTEASWVDSTVSSGATTMPIVTGIAAAQWTTDPAAVPFDVNVAGERCTVSAIAGGDMAFVGVGTSAVGNNASVTPGLPAGVAVGDVVLIFASIRNSGTGTVNLPAGWTNISQFGNCRLAARVYDGVWTMPTVAFTGGVAGADTIAQSCAFRNIRVDAIGSAQLNGVLQNIDKLAQGLVNPPTEDVLVLFLGWKQATWTSVDTSATVPGAIEIGEQTASATGAGQVWAYGIRRIDPVTGAAPAITWAVTGGTTAISRSATQGFRRAPQTFTVVRAVNGVVKGHSALDKVRLWKTPRYSL